MQLLACSLSIFLLFTSIEAQEKETECFNGVLVNGSCACFPGFAGSKCQDCVGRFVLTEREGTISNGPDVAHFSNCLAIIQPPNRSNETLHVRFDYLVPSCRCDFLAVYEGDSVHGPFLATFNGDVLPTRLPEVTTSGGAVALQFHNDGKIFFDEGYEISYWLQDNNCQSPCTNESHQASVTSCSGQWCSFAWTNTANQGRASAGTALVDEFLFVFGGKMFGSPDDSTNFLRLNTSSSEWEVVATSGGSPSMRHGHTVELWKNRLLMYGGAFLDNTITNELWEFDISQSRWSLLLNNSNFGDEAPPLIGHSAHVTSDVDGREVMLSFFGFHPTWLINPHVFQLDLVNKQWKRLSTKGALPIATYGHASAFDPVRNVVYIHGGFNFNIYNHLYAYDVDGMEWSVLPSSPHSRYLHTMALMAGSLYIYGGKGEVPSLDRCDLCREMTTTAYNLDCKEWKVVPEDLLIASPRYGHSMEIMSNKTMLIYGGYDGTMNSDIITFTVDDSSSVIMNKTECNNGSCQPSGTESTPPQSCVKNESTICDAICSSLVACEDCASSSCRCCYDDLTSTCFHGNTSSCDQDTECDEGLREVQFCAQMETCDSCRSSGCLWEEPGSFCGVNKDNTSSPHCPETCSMMSSCAECASLSGCSWCASSSSCFPAATSAVYFPYGGCSDYAGIEIQCDVDQCHKYQSCDECFDNDKCGWCDYGSETGYGSCMGGSLHGPMNMTCPSEQWHFIGCPACQCNGHSTCPPEQPDQCSDCDVGTAGPTCGDCDVLYFGNPTNGRNCTACECNKHASQCSSDGSCYCDVKGIVGKNCERCSSALGYNGDAVNDSCFYSLDVKFEYYVPLDSFESINFDLCPPRQTSVTVSLDTNDNPPFNVIITTNGTDANETIFAALSNVTRVKVTLSQKQFQFGTSEARCIRIYVEGAYNQLVISVRQPKTTIGKLIGFLLVSFLIMLVIAGIVWKGSCIVLERRRRARVAVERRRLAARPFSFVHLCVDEKGHVMAPSGDENACIVSEEICQSNKAAVCTSLLWLPTENKPGPTNVAFGTFLAKRHDLEDDVIKDVKQQPTIMTQLVSSWNRIMMRRAGTPQQGVINMNYGTPQQGVININYINEEA